MKRNLSIELVKFLAVLLVANSHMDVVYCKYPYLATGGAIGDCLFFFASGFTLFLGRMSRFDNWYKRRFNRIYPSIIALALITSLIDIEHLSIKDILLGGGEWFIQCIMIYYVVLYFIRLFFEHKATIPIISITAIVVLYFYFIEDHSVGMYGQTYFKWFHYFIFMLIGAYTGNGTIKMKQNLKFDTTGLFFSTVLFYMLLFLTERYTFMANIEYITLLPLVGIAISIYNIACDTRIVKFLESSKAAPIKILSGLCLESYLVQRFVITDRFNNLFPFNVVIVFFLIFISAYIVRSISRMIVQIFNKEDLDWKKAFSLL